MKTSYLMNKTFHFSIFIPIKLNDEDIDYFIAYLSKHTKRNYEIYLNKQILLKYVF